MHEQPVPKLGCYQGSYPNIGWTEVPCLKVDPPPNVPAQVVGRPLPTGGLSPQDAPPEQVGNGLGIGLQGSSSHNIGGVQGSFWLVDNLNGIFGPRFHGDCSGEEYGSDHFSYQLNSNWFHDPNCPGGMAGPACAWQQFVFNNDVYDSTPIVGGYSAATFIQSWLIGQTNCPSGWLHSGGSCYKNSGTAGVPHQTYQQLSSTFVQGWTDATSSTVHFYTGGDVYAVWSGVIPSFGGQWTQADFNIYGSACMGSIDLNGAVLGPRITIIGQWPGFTSNAAPVPFAGSSTGETNTMNVVPGSACARPGGPANDFGSVQFLQSSWDRFPMPPAPFCLLNDIAVLK